MTPTANRRATRHARDRSDLGGTTHSFVVIETFRILLLGHKSRDRLLPFGDLCIDPR